MVHATMPHGAIAEQEDDEEEEEDEEEGEEEEDDEREEAAAPNSRTRTRHDRGAAPGVLAAVLYTNTQLPSARTTSTVVADMTRAPEHTAADEASPGSGVLPAEVNGAVAISATTRAPSRICAKYSRTHRAPT